MALRIRRIGLLAVSAHMYATLRFIYSWPMDSAWLDPSTGKHEYVDKFPSFTIVDLTPQHWHSSSQAVVVAAYRGATIALLVITIVVILSEHVIYLFKKYFYGHRSLYSKATFPPIGIPLSAVTSLHTYCPTINCAEEKFVCAHTNLSPTQRSRVVYTHIAGEEADVTTHVPSELRFTGVMTSLVILARHQPSPHTPAAPHSLVLSVVKSYECEIHSEMVAKAYIEAERFMTIFTRDNSYQTN